MPKVSVIVPIYNVEKYLRQCLDSLINQTLTDIEIICVNDGSTDTSLEIIKEYSEKDCRIKYTDKQNAGYGHTINKGLNLVTGEYVGIVESDDYAELDMFEDLYKTAKQFDADIVKSNWYEYFSKKHKINRKMSYIGKQDELKILNPRKDKFIFSIPPSIWSAIYKKEFIQQNNINFLETPGASYQDTSFQFKVFAKTEKMILMHNAYIHYRQDNLNSSINNKDKIFCLCDEFQEIEKFLDDNQELKPYFEAIKNINMFNCYEWNLNRLDKTLQSIFVNKFSKTYTKLYNDSKLDKEFFEKIAYPRVMLLINDPKKYLKHFRREQIVKNLENCRRNLFSIHANKTELSIVICGRQIINFN